jgi:hypothetical protein
MIQLCRTSEGATLRRPPARHRYSSTAPFGFRTLAAECRISLAGTGKSRGFAALPPL